MHYEIMDRLHERASRSSICHSEGRTGQNETQPQMHALPVDDWPSLDEDMLRCFQWWIVEDEPSWGESLRRQPAGYQMLTLAWRLPPGRCPSILANG